MESFFLCSKILLFAGGIDEGCKCGTVVLVIGAGRSIRLPADNFGESGQVVVV